MNTDWFLLYTHACTRAHTQTHTHTHTRAHTHTPVKQSACALLLLPQGGAPDSAPVPNGDAPNQSSNDAKDTLPMDDTPDKHDDIPTDDAASKEVRPLYELSMVGKCECSACISSVAARYTQVRT